MDKKLKLNWIKCSRITQKKSLSLIFASAEITDYNGLFISDVYSFAIGNLFCYMLDTIILEAPLLTDVKRNGKENNNNKKLFLRKS